VIAALRDSTSMSAHGFLQAYPDSHSGLPRARGAETGQSDGLWLVNGGGVRTIRAEMDDHIPNRKVLLGGGESPIG